MMYRLPEFDEHFDYRFDLMPTTYILPQDKKLLRVAWKKGDCRKPWIIKPVRMGIYSFVGIDGITG